jgi:hypothetical protein
MRGAADSAHAGPGERCGHRHVRTYYHSGFPPNRRGDPGPLRPPDAPRLYYDESGRLLEATESIHPGDRFAHTMNLKRGAP